MRVFQSFFVILSYAIFLLFFGYLGYQMSGSAMSLLMGAFLAIVLLIACGGLLYQKRWGLYTLWTTLIGATAMFGIRSWITHKPVPIFLFLLSAGVIAILCIRNPSKSS